MLVSTLVDPVQVSKEELNALYVQRWHIELDLRAIKAVMGMETLRCKKRADGAERGRHLFSRLQPDPSRDGAGRGLRQTIAAAAEFLWGEAHDQRLHGSSQRKGRTGSDPNVRVSAGRNRAFTRASQTEPSRASGR